MTLNLSRLCCNTFLLKCNRSFVVRNSMRLFSTSNKKECIVSNKYMPRAAYSVATKANGFIFVSGQLGTHTDQMEKFVSNQVEQQTEQVLNKIKGILQQSGSSMNNITKITILLSDINDFAAVNKVYADFFNKCGVDSNQLPARAAYAVAALPMGAKVEIEAIAIE
eukprot:UN07870